MADLKQPNEVIMSTPDQESPRAPVTPSPPFVSHTSPVDDPAPRQRNDYKSAKCTSSTYPRFLIAKTKNPTDLPLTKQNAVVVEKAIKGIAGTQVHVTYLSSGHLLMETENSTYSKNLIKATKFGNIDVVVEPHFNLNSSKGVIFADCMIDTITKRPMNNEQILEDLKDQGVIEVYRVISRRQGVSLPTNTIILTFDRPNLPDTIKYGYRIFRIKQYIPNPRRCFNCQDYGHSKNYCKKQPVCGNCSQEGHDAESCVNDAFCIHCETGHSVSSRNCPQWKKEKRIIQLKKHRKHHI